MKLISLFLYFLLINFSSKAQQWVQTKGPYGGVTTAMITVGNNIYAATRDWGLTDGRVYRSSDNGNLWVGADAGIPTAYSVFTQFANINETIIGSANYLFRTQNQGANWAIKNTGMSGQPLCVMAKGNLFFAGTSGGGVFVSSDLADNWVQRSNGLGGPGASVICQDLEQLGRYVFVGCRSGGASPARLYRTSDDGLNWYESNTGLPLGSTPFQFAVNGSTIFASVSGVVPQAEYGLYRSLDSGATWQACNNGIPQAIYGNTGEVYANNGVVYVSIFNPTGPEIIYKSTDDGNSFVNSSTGLPPYNEVKSYTSANGYVFSGGGNYSTVFRSANNGLTWEEGRRGLANCEMHSLMEHNGKLYAGGKEGLFYTTDMGDTWITSTLGVGQINTLEKYNSNIYAGTELNGIYRSVDNGNTWTLINNGLTTATYSTNINDILNVNGTLYAGTWSGVYKSTDNGNNWAVASTGIPISMSTNEPAEIRALFESNGVLLAGTAQQKIYRSVDNGATWTFSGNGISTAASTVNAFVKVGSSLFATTESGVYKSTDNGLNWVVNPVLNGGFFRRIVYANGVLYASQYGSTVLTGYGIVRSSDGGATWQTFNEGMRANARLLDLLFYNNVLFGATDTRSVWGRQVVFTPVPVKMSALTGSHRNGKNILDWSTYTEENNKGFEIERSLDGNIFNKINFIASQSSTGNSSERFFYQDFDSSLHESKYWYRLKQLDLDGKFQYSNIVLLINPLKSYEISVLHPNPVSHEIRFEIKSSKNLSLMVKILDAAGKQHVEKTIAVLKGKKYYSLNTSLLSSGVYFLVLSDGYNNDSMKFIK